VQAITAALHLVVEWEWVIIVRRACLVLSFLLMGAAPPVELEGSYYACHIERKTGYGYLTADVGRKPSGEVLNRNFRAVSLAPPGWSDKSKKRQLDSQLLIKFDFEMRSGKPAANLAIADLNDMNVQMTFDAPFKQSNGPDEVLIAGKSFAGTGRSPYIIVVPNLYANGKNDHSFSVPLKVLTTMADGGDSLVTIITHNGAAIYPDHPVDLALIKRRANESLALLREIENWGLDFKTKCQYLPPTDEADINETAITR
jgi:hypothetical protein